MPEQERPIGFDIVLAEITPQRLSRWDPLARLFLRLSPCSAVPIFIAALLLNGVLIVGAGFVIGAIYGCERRLHSPFICMSDPRMLIPDVLGNIVSFSIIWAFYAWQVRGLPGMLRRLDHNGVIGPPRAGVTRDSLATIGAPFDRRSWALPPVAVTLLGFVLWYQAARAPGDAFHLGGATMWYFVNPTYFWIVYFPLVFVNLYMLGWIVIRGAILWRVLKRVFDAFEVRPIVHHRDRCNGFAPVGTVAICNGLMVVLIGFWVAFFVAFPALVGRPIKIGPDIVGMLAAYLVGAPALVLCGTWSAHCALRDAKQRSLDEVGEQIRRLLAETDTTRIHQSAGMLEEWQRRYEIKRREYRAWPFRSADLGGFGLSVVASPYVSWLITLGIEKYILGL